MLSRLRILPFSAFLMIAMSIAIAPCARAMFVEKAASPSVEVGLRIVWGGNEPSSYIGEIQHEDSSLKVIQELSLDRSGTIRKSDKPERILIYDPTTRFGGCDIKISAKLDSVLRLKFKPEQTQGTPAGNSIEPLETQFTLRQILEGPKELVLGPKSRIVVDRIPGDALRIGNTRSNWVFNPGEPLLVQATPNLTGANGQSANLEWEILIDGKSDPIEHGSMPVSLDDQGSSTSINLGEINAPSREGVYEIHIQLRPRRSFTQVFRPNIAERRIQFVVTSTEAHERISEMDGSRHRAAFINWNNSSLGKEFLPHHSLPVSVRPWGRVTDNFKRLSINKHDDEPTLVTLGARETLSLPIEDLQPLHAYTFFFSTESTMDGLEVQFSEVIEAGNENKLRTISSAKVQPTLNQLLSTPSTNYQGNYSFRFKPSTTKALIRITSLRANGAMNLGQFRVESSLEQPLSGIKQHVIGRKGIPKIIEYMNADEWRTMLTRGRYLRGKSRFDTWGTISESLDEWLRLCKERGANCVAIPVVSSGSALYPTERLLTNPILNTGTFDSDGRDPNPKDLVHWIYRLCEKHDLDFIPVFEWNHSLHSFKYLQIKEDMWGTVSEESAVEAGPWNPFHSEVQVEMKSVLKEFEKRYGNLKLYRGYAIHLGKSSNLSLSESIEQISDPIVDKLLADHFGRIPHEPKERRLALSQLSGNLTHQKHQQALLSIVNEWNCDLAYVFTDVQQSYVDLSQTTPAIVYIHPPGHNFGPWIARRWWLEGFKPIAYQTNVADSQIGIRGIIPEESDWLEDAVPIEGQALQRRIDRVRAWRSTDSTRAVILNANPWACTINLQWSVIPQNLKTDNAECLVSEIELSPSSRNITIPSNQMVVLSWDNPNATPYSWGTDESVSMQSYQAALQSVEAAINLCSIPVGRNDLLNNSDFDQDDSRSKGNLIPGWGSSINPNAQISLLSESPHSEPNHLRVECEPSGAAAWLQSSKFQLQSNRLQVTMHYRVKPGKVMNLQWTLFLWNDANSRFEIVSRRSASMDFSKRTDEWGKWTEDFSEELTDLGVNQNHSFRLQLDVQGDCTIDIDSISLATDYLLERERMEFRNTLFLARRSLTEGSSEAVYRLLDSALVRTLLLWTKDSVGIHPTASTNLSRAKAIAPSASPTQPKSQPDPEKRSADRRWKFWNR